MILEHEIPTGTKLYFGQSAAKKRAIESKASEALSRNGFEEILTPLFSYHQHQSIANQCELIRIGDTHNHNMSLRADSTVDVVNIIEKRLGRNTKHKKWFYIQPVYRYPSSEQYQVGAEIIGERDVALVLQSVKDIFTALEISPLLQISNINIPKKLSTMLELSLDDFKHINVNKILSLGIKWLSDLVYLHDPKDIEPLLPSVPEEIRADLQLLQELCEGAGYGNVFAAPLYYAKMLYYDDIYFKMIQDNHVLLRGGRYASDGVTSVGFAIETDILVDVMMEKEG